MKRLVFLVTALAASFGNIDRGQPSQHGAGTLSFVAQAQARRQSAVSFSVFYQSLRPYGHWAQYRPYGYVFIPHVGRDWRPYSDGRWVHSARYGWVWDSYEPFGWATFHYGWWDFDPHYGWFWVPGYEWAPSWVVWRQSDDFIGWAPMPARYVWGRPYLEIRIGWRDSYWNDPRPWCFTRSRHIGDRRASHYIAPIQQNVTFINKTTTVYNTTVINNTIVNEGPDVAAVEQASGAQVARAEINPVAEPPPVTAADAGSSEAMNGDTVILNAFIPESEPAIDGSQIIAAPAGETIPAALASEAPVLEPTIAGPASPEASATPEPAPAFDDAVSPGLAPMGEHEHAAPAQDAPAPQAEPGIAVGEPDPSEPMPAPDMPDSTPIPPFEPAPVDNGVNEPPIAQSVPQTIPEPMPEPSYPPPEMAAPEPGYPTPESAPEPQYAPPPEPEYSAPAPEAMPVPAEPMAMPEPAPMPQPEAMPAPEGAPPG